jgi:hypothetical protein
VLDESALLLDDDDDDDDVILSNTFQFNEPILTPQ